MVPDLKKIKSHPDKLLKVHVEGVKEKALLRNNNVITELSALFHDLGKINPNFQDKLTGIKNVGYSQHSYISAFSFLNWYVSNRDEANKLLKVEGLDFTKLKIISSIILHHHGNLPNIDENFSEQALDAMMEFLTSNSQELPISIYLSEEIGLIHNYFDLTIKHWYKKNNPIRGFLNERETEVWKQNALDNFLETQFSFASLIESDKRDAGEIQQKNCGIKISESIKQLKKTLNLKFEKLSSFQYISELNKLRTEIRVEAVRSISDLLNTQQRVFTLTAPTGAGKTYTLLAIAKEIQQQKGELGIIFALPFLSITEQVQNIIEMDLKNEVLQISSKSHNERIENAQKEYEIVQTESNLKALLIEDFIENTFDHPLIITTFVQLFETLLSNRNSTLLKLPNFSNRIFLIDEIQALPPRLYIFFSAWLDAFCKRYNSYAILSTATMPNLEIPSKTELKDNSKFEIKNPSLLFKEYEKPNDLLKPEKFFSNQVFNRYKVTVLSDEMDIDSLSSAIIEQENSCLVILNTIQDTKDLYEKVKDLSNVFLLNTHFTPNDRLAKISEVNTLLTSEKVILISTQLIEAGVDIDFPVVYRDLCPLPSLIQSAGRCNRNKKQDFGQVYMFQLVKENGKVSSELVYRNEARRFLDFIKENIRGSIYEKDLFDIQKKFFSSIANDLEIGEYPEEDFNLIEKINKAQFATVGKFQLISNRTFGKQYQFYVPKNNEDTEFEMLENIVKNMSIGSYEESKKSKIKLNLQLKRMSGQIVSVRLIDESMLPIQTNEKDVFGIKKIDINFYSDKKGVLLNKSAACIL